MVSLLTDAKYCSTNARGQQVCGYLERKSLRHIPRNPGLKNAVHAEMMEVGLAPPESSHIQRQGTMYILVKLMC